MMLCLLEGLANKMDLNDIADAWVRWMLKGYWTPRGRVFDIGGDDSRIPLARQSGARPEDRRCHE
jgi:ADP-ribosylglycohydrolase